MEPLPDKIGNAIALLERYGTGATQQHRPLPQALNAPGNALGNAVTAGNMAFTG